LSVGSHLFLLYMIEWLAPLLALLVLPVVVLTGFAFYATRALRRANRLLPGRSLASPPLRWRWSPGPAAILHRRLKAACQLAAPVAGTPPASGRVGLARRWRLGRRQRTPRADVIAELASDVIKEAVVLDRELVSANILARGLARARILSSLEQQVRAIEESANRVHMLALRRASLVRTGGPSGLSLDERISAMEAALGELGLGSDRTTD
jgi:hypothetical protein